MWPKIEKTRQHKSSFMTQYWGQEVLRYNEVEKRTPQSKCTTVDHFSMAPTLFFDDSFLLLKATDSLSDEDINVCYNLYCAYVAYDGTMDFKPQDEMAKHWYENEALSVIDDVPIIVDYLRSKGYALPYLTLSVAEQITYGWIKLKNF